VRLILLKLALALAAVGTIVACSKGIGDECLTGGDCNPQGDRSCDLAQPGGYCTVEGCDARSCPEDSVCIRFFPEMYLSKTCPPLSAGACAADELCLKSGVCARRASERRYCARTCGDNGDCRSGYECRLAGDRGSMALVPDPNGNARFCAPYVP
jgi:hypothetical protein